MIKRRHTAIADAAEESRIFNNRAIFSFCFVVLCFCILLGNLYYLQVVRFEEYSTRADGNRIKLLPISPNRGMIFDRRGNLLAENAPVHSIEIVPEQTDDLKQTVAAIANLIEITPEQQQAFFKEVKQQRRFKSIALKEQLTEEEVAKLAVHMHKLKGAALEARLTRFYPYGDVLTHALGYIGKINEKEYKKLDELGISANYAATRDIGKVGVEKFYEDKLHGNVGYQEVEVNNRGRVIRILHEQPAISGDDLYLTLDLGLQLKAQEILGERRGAIVAMEPKTGAILAFYSNPSYDPNLFVHGIRGKDYRMLLNSPDRPLVNRMTQGVYPPASTVKPLMAVAGLEQGLITEGTRIPDPGFYRLPNVSRPWRDHIKWGHGYVDVYTGIIKSCDTYFYDLAYKMGVDRIHDFMKKVGYGRASGIDIYEETTGLMPSREWKKARRKQNWGPGDTINIGIGQGFWQSTPLQLAITTATLINNGARITPRLGESFRNNTGRQSLLVPSEQAVDVVNPNNWTIAREAMRRTAQNDGGTAHGAFLGATFNPAGKTGTAQVINIAAGQKYNAHAIDERHRDNALFIGFAPYENPEIVVSVILENAGGGGSNAAPVARQVMDYYFSEQYNNPQIPDRVAMAKQQAERAKALVEREARYAAEAEAEKAEKAAAKLRALSTPAVQPAPAPVTTGPAASSTPVPAATSAQPNTIEASTVEVRAVDTTPPPAATTAPALSETEDDEMQTGDPRAPQNTDATTSDPVEVPAPQVGDEPATESNDAADSTNPPSPAAVQPAGSSPQRAQGDAE